MGEFDQNLINFNNTIYQEVLNETVAVADVGAEQKELLGNNNNNNNKIMMMILMMMMMIMMMIMILSPWCSYGQHPSCFPVFFLFPDLS